MVNFGSTFSSFFPCSPIISVDLHDPVFRIPSSRSKVSHLGSKTLYSLLCFPREKIIKLLEEFVFFYAKIN